MTKLFDIKGDKHAADVVKEFIAVDKVPIGNAHWARNGNDGHYRMKLPLETGGLPTDGNICVDTRSLNGFDGFAITLNLEECVWRLDFVPEYKPHPNPLNEMATYEPVVYGPHFHSWDDNCHQATPNGLPKKLPVARSLRANIKTYEAAIRWFCGEVRITLSNHHITELPKKDSLF